MKIYFDTCTYINLLTKKNKNIFKLFIKLIKDNKIELIISHGIYDDGFRKKINNIPKTEVPTGCFVLGYSRWGKSRFGDPEGIYHELTKELPDKSKNKIDAINRDIELMNSHCNCHA